MIWTIDHFTGVKPQRLEVSQAVNRLSDWNYWNRSGLDFNAMPFFNLSSCNSRHQAFLTCVAAFHSISRLFPFLFREKNLEAPPNLNEIKPSATMKRNSRDLVSHIGREKADMLPYFSRISGHACPESRGLTIF